ncbi:DUF881 domain-containing protein [bacterium]|nr:DUF881 domain-containing protein [bacterium]
MLKTGLALAAMILGFLAVLPLKAVAPKDSRSVDVRQEVLVQMLEASDAERQLLQKEVSELRNEVQQFQQDALSGKSSLEMIQEKLNSIENLAGLSTVSGPGIELTLSDAGKRVIDIGPGSIDREALVVHDQDLMLLINELKAAGAEAISIKSGSIEERVVGSTFIRCTGPALIVNNRKMASPFTVRAIGDPDVLVSGLEIPDGLLDQLRTFGITVRIVKVKDLVIPGYEGSRVFNFADVVKSPDVEEVRE